MHGSDDRTTIHYNELPDIHPVNNLVLVYVGDTEVRTKAGLYLGDPTWDVSGHFRRRGRVIAVPEKLGFRTKKYTDGLEWRTNVDIEVGDDVFFGVMAANDSPAIVVDNQIYLLIRYSDLIIRVRDNVLYPLNGNVLLEEVIDKPKAGSLIVPDIAKHRNNKKGIVRYVGEANESYFSGMVDSEGFDVGDTVYFAAPFFTPLEDERYRTLEEDLGYTQRRWIIAKD